MNKKSISNYENQLFQAELEKFRPYQTRLLQANHKQSSLMKDLTVTFNNLLQDKRVRSEQSKYEAITRQRTSVMSKYKRVYQEFLDLEAGLGAAKKWYSEMKDTVNSLDKNVETFVSNRRSEGAQLLNQIEQDRASNSGGQADRERERLRGLMERMSMDPTHSPSNAKARGSPPRMHSTISPSAQYPTTNFAGNYQLPSSPPPHPTQMTFPSYASHQPGSFYSSQSQQRTDSYGSGQRPSSQPQGGYDPGSYLRREQGQPISPPPNQQYFSQSQYGYQPPSQQSSTQPHHVPPGYVPPPPPPGPPPLGPQQTFQPPPTMYSGAHGYSAGPTNGQQRTTQQQGGSADPWAGLNAWK